FTSTRPAVKSDGPAKVLLPPRRRVPACVFVQLVVAIPVMFAEMLRSVATLVSWVSLIAKVLVAPPPQPEKKVPRPKVPLLTVAAEWEPLLPWKLLTIRLAPPRGSVPPPRLMSAL